MVFLLFIFIYLALFVCFQFYAKIRQGTNLPCRAWDITVSEIKYHLFRISLGYLYFLFYFFYFHTEKSRSKPRIKYPKWQFWISVCGVETLDFLVKTWLFKWHLCCLPLTYYANSDISDTPPINMCKLAYFSAVIKGYSSAYPIVSTDTNQLFGPCVSQISGSGLYRFQYLEKQGRELHHKFIQLTNWFIGNKEEINVNSLPANSSTGLSRLTTVYVLSVYWTSLHVNSACVACQHPCHFQWTYLLVIRSFKGLACRLKPRLAVRCGQPASITSDCS